MKKRGKLDLASNFAQNVSRFDTMEVLQIRCSEIQQNKENFFEVSGIEELADSIDLVGLQQPLVVTKSDNGYLLIAGHRRFAAVKRLGWETVPCIVSKPINDELEILALIQTNTQTRDLTYTERMEAVKRTEQALKSLKDKGYQFSGRLRDKIAEVTGESKTSVAYMQAIEKKLTDEGKKMLKSGELSPDAAYEMQKMPKQKQNEFTAQCRTEKKSPTKKEVQRFINAVEEIPTVPAWWWKPVNDKPKKPCNIILAKKQAGEWQYRCVFAIDNFDDWVESLEAEYWCEIQAP